MIRFLQTPGPIKKVVLGGMLIVICVAMLVYLIPSSGSSSSGNPSVQSVATVDGNDITAVDVRNTARQMAQQQAARYGAQASMIMPFLLQQATQQAADQLITRQVLISQAHHLGLRVTPAEIQDELQHGRYAPTFFPGGNFIGETEYEDMLSRANLTPTMFEDSVGSDILIGKLQALIAGGASVSDAEVRKECDKENTKVKFEYAVLKQDDLRKGLHPTDAELQAFYESHKKTYANSIPEKRKIKYAVIDLSQVRGSVEVSREDLQTYYDQHRDLYRVPEQIKVSHIWIKSPLPGVDGKTDEKALADAQHRAEDLLKQVKNGAKFEDVAKKYSEDPGSANVGGSLGWIGKGRTTPEFEKAAYALSKGQTSGVVKSSDGFHIIRLDDKHEAHLKTLDEVKDQIEPILKQQKAAQAAQKEADALLTQAKAVGLDAAAATEKIPVINSDFVARKDILPGLGQAAQFMDAVFTTEEKSPPEMAPTSQGFAVFQLLAVKPPETPTFEDIRSRVQTEFENERSGVLLSQKTQELSDRAKAEHDLKRAAKELGAEIKTSDFVLPDGQVPDVGSMSGQAAVAFNMKPGDISIPITNANNGVVLQVLEVQAPTDAEYADKSAEIRDSLLQYKQQQLFGLFVTNLKDEMKKSGKIKTDEELIKTLAKGNSEEGM
ncbi:MAG: peptidyl-prolyl cis-trans isomerase [Candidatus Sulfotelmatobacter sp.]